MEGGSSNLLARVRRLLRHKNWETRVAAAHAIDAICKRVPVWEPSSCVKMEDVDNGKAADPLSVQGLAKLDIKGIIERGQTLVSSTGAEFDDVTDGIADPKERLAAKKQQLRAALGLDAAAGGKGDGMAQVAAKRGDADLFNMKDLVKDEDVEMQSASQARGSASSASKRKASDIIEDMHGKGEGGAGDEAMAHLSARERNQLRRKQRKTQRDGKDAGGVGGGGKMESKAVVTSQPQNSGKVVVESSVTEVVQADPNEWPLGPFCDDLAHDIFDPCWEVRHGAAMALRDILKHHSTSAGKWAGTSVEQQSADNQLWVEECTIRILCVLALDRFGDYVSDPVVAPVRETCAQVLGVLLQRLRDASVSHVARILEDMQGTLDWEVRHGGMLGMKYLIAVRKETIIGSLLPQVLPLLRAAIAGEDDDVRAVAAEALLPLSQHLVADAACFQEFGRPLLALLWATIEQLDDLTASTAAVMSLVAEMADHLPPREAVGIGGGTGKDAGQLMQSLYPFFRHNTSSVRRSVLKIACNLANLCFNAAKASSSANWLQPGLGDTLHRVFLNIILEQRPDILATSHELWDQLMGVTRGNDLAKAVAGYMKLWLHAVATPPGQSLDPQVLGGSQANSKARDAAQKKRAKALARAQGGGGIAGKEEADADADEGVGNLDDLSASVKMRLSGVRAMGALAWRLQATGGDQSAVTSQVTLLLSSQLGTHAQVGALLLCEWAAAACSGADGASCYTLLPAFQAILDEKLATIGQTDYPYSEIANLSAKWRGEVVEVLQEYSKAGIKDATAAVKGLDASNLSIVRGVELAQQAAEWETQVKSKEKEPKKAAESAKRRTKAVRQVFITIGQLKEVQTNLHTSVLAVVASVLVAAQNLPAKIGPVIRALMDSLQRESNRDLQRRTAKAMVGLVRLCVDRKPCPNGKVTNNLATYLCEDPTFTPQCSDKPQDVEAVTMEEMTYLPPEDDTILEGDVLNPHREARIRKRGASMALEEIACGLGGAGGGVFAMLPALLVRMRDPLVTAFGEVKDGSACHFEAAKMQELVDSLQLARTIAGALPPADLASLEALMPCAVRALESKHGQLRQMAARFLSEMCCTSPLAGMEVVIRTVLPLLGDTGNATRRLGATEALYRIVMAMDLKVLPYAIFLVVPILGRMSDQHIAVRQTVTKTFATLLRLLPLEAGIPDPEGLSADLVAEKKKERHFLEQLLDASKIENFEIPIKIAADLRRYQQEGVNWMAFLMKYQLHGILCDDMGLGKTLQSISIMASSHHNRRVQFAATKDASFAPYPSLVVCPPTLVGHWAFEISKFLPNKTLESIQFVGSPAERGGLRDAVRQGGDCVVITSYDTLRNEIAFLGEFNWNYCVLDEGHVIKNGKSKTTQAVKTVKANHRLLLSGTPIQNNALELWSLFDFLMPGFLGTEKSFNQVYSKPILASRNAKCTSRESEAGVLALEALHRQVLPFMLRRTKTEVLSDLPPKIIQDFMCDLSPLQQRLYNDFAAKQKAGQMVTDAISSATHSEGSGGGGKGKKESAAGGDKGVATHIFQALQYLRKLSNHPKLVLGPDHPEMANVSKTLKAEGTTLDDISLAPKLLALRQILWDCGIGSEDVKKEDESSDVADGSSGRHRVLVFAQMKSMLDIIEHDLFRKAMPGVTYLRMDGSTPNARRFEMQQQFNGDPSLDVLLLTTHVGGLGLNLTGADTVVFVEHDWNPMRDLQAMDRAHRIGQKKVVNVYRLVTKNTLEEKIMGLQRFKLSIANSIVNEDNASLKNMDTSQLLDLFTPVDAAATSETDKKEVAGGGDAAGTGKLSQVLSNLEELWDESQYQEAFNVDSFVSSLT